MFRMFLAISPVPSKFVHVNNGSDKSASVAIELPVFEMLSKSAVF